MGEILVTGLGVVSPLGFSGDEIWRSLQSGVAPAPNFSGVPSFDVLEKRKGYYLTAAQRLACDASADCARASDYAIAAGRRALDDAGLCGSDTRPIVGAVIGSGMGDAQHWRETRRAAPQETDFIFRDADRLAEALDLDGPVLEVSTACAAGAYAIAAASMLLRAGDADAILCGGADAPSFHALAAFNRLGALDDAGCRPFDARRQGTLFGEGAAILVLERADSFHARGGARAYARLSGFGLSCDGVHPTAPAEDGAQLFRAMSAALERSGVEAAEIDVILPHATGTQLNDLVESAVIQRIFGPRTRQPWSLPLKAFAGHGGGMSGALSALVAALVVARDQAPPAATCERAPECEVRLPDRMIQGSAIANAIVNASAFGGANISLLFGKSGARP